MISLYELDLLLPDFSYFSLNCLSYTILSCPWMCLSTCSSMLTLDIYILQQTVLTVPQQPVRPLDSSKSLAAYAACPWTRTGTAACAAFGRACPTAAYAQYAAFGRVCPTAAFAASGLTRSCYLAACLCLYSSLRPLDSSVLQQHVLPQDVCLIFDRLCWLWLSVPQQPWKSFWFVSVFFRNSSVCFGCFDMGLKHRNKPKYFVFGFTKQTETNAKQILFRFVSVRTEIYFCLFRGHPTPNPTMALAAA